MSFEIIMPFLKPSYEGMASNRYEAGPSPSVPDIAPGPGPFGMIERGDGFWHKELSSGSQFQSAGSSVEQLRADIFFKISDPAGEKGLRSMEFPGSPEKAAWARTMTYTWISGAILASMTHLPFQYLSRQQDVPSRGAWSATQT